MSSRDSTKTWTNADKCLAEVFIVPVNPLQLDRHVRIKHDVFVAECFGITLQAALPSENAWTH